MGGDVGDESRERKRKYRSQNAPFSPPVFVVAWVSVHKHSQKSCSSVPRCELKLALPYRRKPTAQS